MFSATAAHRGVSRQNMACEKQSGRVLRWYNNCGCIRVWSISPKMGCMPVDQPIDTTQKFRPLSLRSDAGKALLRLTKAQFSDWERQLSEVTTDEFNASHSMHYWYIMSTLALDGDEEFKVLKKRAEEALPRASTETGRRYLSECEKLGLTRTIRTKGYLYAALTEAGEKALANTLGRWITEFAKVRRSHDRQTAAVSTEGSLEIGPVNPDCPNV
jgi:hypothetical protein